MCWGNSRRTGVSLYSLGWSRSRKAIEQGDRQSALEGRRRNRGEREGRQGDVALQPQPEGRNDAEDPSEVGSVAGGIATGYRGNTRSTLTPAGHSVGDLGQQAGPPARSPRRCSSRTDLRMIVGQGMTPEDRKSTRLNSRH